MNFFFVFGVLTIFASFWINDIEPFTYHMQSNSDGQKDYFINGTRTSESEFRQILSSNNVEYPSVSVVFNQNNVRTPSSSSSSSSSWSASSATHHSQSNNNGQIEYTNNWNNSWGSKTETRYSFNIGIQVQTRTFNIDENIPSSTESINRSHKSTNSDSIRHFAPRRPVDDSYQRKEKEIPENTNVANNVKHTKIDRELWKSAAQSACEKYSGLAMIENRILGRQPAEFPWVAALGYLDLSNKVDFKCIGTLISEKFILTAAQCARDDNRPILVQLGQTSLNGIGERQQIGEIIRHPNYSRQNKTNDIALIKLASPVQFDGSIRPACLQTDLRDEDPSVDLTVAGWSILSPDRRNRSDELRKAKINTIPWSECNSIVLNYTNTVPFWTPFRNGIEHSHYCAADPKRQTDTCEGDGGGPLQIIHPNANVSTVVGVVSTGFSCGTPFPGIYTRVAYFIDWIESHVWPNGEIA